MWSVSRCVGLIFCQWPLDGDKIFRKSVFYYFDQIMIPFMGGMICLVIVVTYFSDITSFWPDP